MRFGHNRSPTSQSTLADLKDGAFDSSLSLSLRDIVPIKLALLYRPDSLSLSLSLSLPLSVCVFVCVCVYRDIVPMKLALL